MGLHKRTKRLMRGDYTDALVYFNNAIALDKNFAPAFSGKAVALNAVGKYAHALTQQIQR